MENETDVTREQMDETRASMSEKMDTLEQRVVDKVHDAANVVGQTVNAVHKTVENVKDTFDVRLQMKRHPWAILGGSIALGCLGGYFLFRRGAAQPSLNAGSQMAAPDRAAISEKPNGMVKAPRFLTEASGPKPIQAVAPPATPGWIGGVSKRFGPEIHKVKGLAIGAVLGVVRDVITQSVPELVKAGFTDVIDGLTVELGGEPIHGPVPKEPPGAEQGDDQPDSSAEGPAPAA